MEIEAEATVLYLARGLVLSGTVEIPGYSTSIYQFIQVSRSYSFTSTVLVQQYRYEYVNNGLLSSVCPSHTPHTTTHHYTGGCKKAIRH